MSVKAVETETPPAGIPAGPSPTADDTESAPALAIRLSETRTVEITAAHLLHFLQRSGIDAPGDTKFKIQDYVVKTDPTTGKEYEELVETDFYSDSLLLAVYVVTGKTEQTLKIARKRKTD